MTDIWSRIVQDPSVLKNKNPGTSWNVGLWCLLLYAKKEQDCHYIKVRWWSSPFYCFWDNAYETQQHLILFKKSLVFELTALAEKCSLLVWSVWDTSVIWPTVDDLLTCIKVLLHPIDLYGGKNKKKCTGEWSWCLKLHEQLCHLNSNHCALNKQANGDAEQKKSLGLWV